MTLYKKRERFDSFSKKTGNFFSKFGLSPNQWTIVSLIPVIVSLYFLVNESFLIAGMLFLLSAFIDIIDGSVARYSNKVSVKGAYLDTIVDRYVEGIILVGLLFVSLPVFYLPSPVWIFLYLFGSLMTTYSKAAAKEKGLVEKELKGGLLERAERLLILFFGIIIASVDPFFLTFIIALLAVLTNISALQRIAIALKK